MAWFSSIWLLKQTQQYFFLIGQSILNKEIKKIWDFYNISSDSLSLLEKVVTFDCLFLKYLTLTKWRPDTIRIILFSLNFEMKWPLFYFLTNLTWGAQIFCLIQFVPICIVVEIKTFSMILYRIFLGEI